MQTLGTSVTLYTTPVRLTNERSELRMGRAIRLAMGAKPFHKPSIKQFPCQYTSLTHPINNLVGQFKLANRFRVDYK